MLQKHKTRLLPSLAQSSQLSWKFELHYICTPYFVLPFIIIKSTV